MGKAKCVICGKELTYYTSKKVRCRECYRKHREPSPMKGVHIQFNTGRTHFKKGMTPWNKGIKWTDEMKAAQSKRLKGRSMPKPKGFAETMRRANPPMGRKIKFDGRDKSKKLRVWRHGYVWVYNPDHPTSRKTSPDYGYVAEHRMVMELHIGRDLKKTEIIHHIDGKKDNNSIENLLCCTTQKEHNKVHAMMEVFVEKLIREGKVYYDREKKEFRFG